MWQEKCPWVETRRNTGEKMVDRHFRAPAIAVIASAFVSSCGVLNSNPPIPSVGEVGEICQPLSKDGYLAFGAGVVQNQDDRQVKVVKVELIDPVGMKLVGTKAVVVPDDGYNIIGSLPGWPPDLRDDPEMEQAFERAKPIEGLTIKPSSYPNLAFSIGVKAVAGARSGPLKVTYERGLNSWVWTGPYRMCVKPQAKD